MSLASRLEQARAELAQHRANPWQRRLEDALRGIQAISTVALLDLLGLPSTSGSARRLAATMRALGFIPLKSRRLMPGGFKDTTIRGWARPLREERNSSPTMKPGDTPDNRVTRFNGGFVP